MRAMGMFMAAGLWSAFATAAPRPVDVTAVHLSAQGARTELVLSLSGAAQHTLFTLSQPNRVVIDVDDAQLKAPLPAGLGMVSSLRSASHDGTLRLVMDLSARAVPQSFLRQGAKGAELVVDLTGPGAAPAPASSVAVDVPAPQPAAALRHPITGATSWWPSTPATAARIPAPTAPGAPMRRT